MGELLSEGSLVIAKNRQMRQTKSIEYDISHIPFQPRMDPTDFWKNFNLGQELSVAGGFIYNGLRQFHEMQSLDVTEEAFGFLYELSVGLERLLKVAVILLEHDSAPAQAEFEETLKTHEHLELLNRVRSHEPLSLGDNHVALLGLLGDFYRTIRYDRYSLSSAYDPKKEIKAIRSFLGKGLNVEIPEQGAFIAVPNEDRYKRYIEKTVRKISGCLYQTVERRARALNLCTYELRHGSKAESVFLRGATVSDEDVLWKELLVFFMNTKGSSGYLEFLRGIPPLEFDPALAGDYLDCFRSNASKAMIMDELEELYAMLGDEASERLKLMGVISTPGVSFICDDEDIYDPDVSDLECGFNDGRRD
jgi:hypothetical protein